MERAKVQVRFVRFFHSFFSCTMGVAASGQTMPIQGSNWGPPVFRLVRRVGCPGCLGDTFNPAQ